MNLVWTKNAWQDYSTWQENDKKILRKINDLIKECLREPFMGSGKPEPLKNNLSGLWSRRITLEHRLVYKVEKDNIIILQCKFHY